MKAHKHTPWHGFLALLRSPWLILGSVLASLVFGLTSPDWALSLQPVGDIYLSMLKIVVLPFLLSAIISSLAKLVKSDAARQYMGRIALFYTVGLVSTACLGLALALVMKPGSLPTGESRSTLGEVVRSSKSAVAANLEISLSETPELTDSKASGIQVAVKYIPSNIFEALTLGDTLKVLIFSIIFGIAAGSTASAKEDFASGLDFIYRSCQTLMRWFIYPLPFAVFAIVSSEVAKSGVDYLLAMQDFVITQIAASVVLFLAATLIISLKLKVGFGRVIRALSEPALLALTTRSSVICIPSAIDALTRNLKTPLNGTELVMPLGVTMFRFGPAFYFAICTIFVAQMYGTELGITDYIFIVFASVLAALASTGTTSVLTISLVSMVCVPLKLPFEAALALFIAADPFVDSFRTLAIVYGNCAASVLVTGGESPADDLASPQSAST
jgi:proton glutamate symport protein